MKLVWLLLLAAAMTVSWRASAADVVLVHPASADPFIEEIFHRVRGELRVQAIAFEERDSTLADLSEAAQQGALKRLQCLACVFFAWRGDTSVVRVWVSGGATKPPALFEAVALERNAETPTLLAARAVDLLASALDAKRAPQEAAQPRSVLAPVAPRSNPELAPPLGPWALGVGITALGAESRWGAAWGPQIYVAWTLSPPLTLRVHVEGPLSGAHYGNAEASAHWLQALGLIELEAELAHFGALALSVLGGAGAHYLHATGAVAAGVSSIAAAEQGHLAPAAAAGLCAALRLSARWSLALAAEALLLAPRPRIAVAQDTVPFSEPALDLSASLRLAL